MKIISLAITCLLLISCGNDVEIEVKVKKVELVDVTEKCQNLEVGMPLHEASELIGYVRHRSKVTQSNNTGHLSYWNGPNIKTMNEINKMKFIIPNGDICKVYFDAEKIITSFKSVYVDPDTL